MTTLQGKVERVLIAPQADSMESESRPVVQVTFAGFEGDRHAGMTTHSGGRTPHYPRGTEIRNSRQVSIVSNEELSAIAGAMALSSLKPEWMGANLCLSGIPQLSHLPTGTRLFFAQGAVLVVESENYPCLQAGRVIADYFPNQNGLAQLFLKMGFGRRGVVAWVEKPGLIEAGETVSVQIPKQAPYLPA